MDARGRAARNQAVRQAFGVSQIGILSQLDTAPGWDPRLLDRLMVEGSNGRNRPA